MSEKLSVMEKNATNMTIKVIEYINAAESDRERVHKQLIRSAAQCLFCAISENADESEMLNVTSEAFEYLLTMNTLGKILKKEQKENE